MNVVLPSPDSPATYDRVDMISTCKGMTASNYPILLD